MADQWKPLCSTQRWNTWNRRRWRRRYYSEQASAIEANTAARWPGAVYVTPHQIPSDTETLTLRAFLSRVDGTFPSGAKMRINAGGRNGAFVAANDNAPAVLSFDQTQTRNLLRNPSNGLVVGNATVKVFNSAETQEIASIPIHLPIVDPASGGDTVDQTARNAAADAEGIATRAEGKADTNTTSIEILNTALQGAVRLGSVEVGSPLEYQAALNAQQSNNTPIILHVTAAISGSRATVAYDHAKGAIFWVRPMSDVLIHLFTLPEGGTTEDGVVFLDEGSTPASASTLGRLRLWQGHLYRTNVVPANPKTVTFRNTPLGDSDLRAGEEWLGVLSVNPSPASAGNNKVYYNRQVGQWDWIRIAGGSLRNTDYNNQAILSKFRGYRNSEAEAKNLATAIGDIVGYGDDMYIVSAYRAGTVAHYEYIRIDEPELERILGLETRMQTAETNITGLVTGVDTAQGAARTAQEGVDAINEKNSIASPAAEQDIDRDNGEVALMTMDKNTTITLSGGVNGDSLILRCTQDGTGSRILTLDVAVGINVAERERPTLSTDANKSDLLMFHRVGTVWQYVGIIKDV